MTVKWGVAGTGNISAATVQESAAFGNVEIVAVSSRRMDRAKAFAAEHGIGACHDDLPGLVADPQVEAVYIALPHVAHANAVIAALDAGKHVLCEKPLAWSAAEIARIAAHPRARELVVAEGFMISVQPQWRFVKETIGTIGIGAVEAVHGISCVRLPQPPDDPTRGNLPFDRSALLDFGSYSVFMARTAFQAEPRRVTARMWEQDDRDTALSIRLEFDAGDADLTVSTRMRGARGFTILGTEGSLSVMTPIHIPPGAKARVHAVLTGKADAGETREFDAVPQYGLHLAEVSSAILTGGRPPVDLDNAIGNALALDAVIRSARNGGAWTEIAAAPHQPARPA